MRLVTFSGPEGAGVGVLGGDHVIDLTAGGGPCSLVELLAAGEPGLDRAREAVEHARVVHALERVTLEAPIPRPGKFLGIGLNYADHARETGREPPEFPTVFCKQATCTNRHGGPIHVPRASSMVDYEGELAFVIGKRCRYVSRAEAPAVIAGYTIVNDVSVRDWQARSPTFTLGKGWDTHGPMGPALVTADAVPDPHALGLRTWVDEELRQDSSTSELIFDCYALIELLSTAFTLEPGDVVTTGTPSGVGVAMSPPRFLEPGALVRIEIDGLGVLENPVIAEP